MKTLIVYYSLQGNTEYAANRIAENIGADTLRLNSKKAYKSKGFAKFLSGGPSAIREETPDLESYDIDLAEYDRVIYLRNGRKWRVIDNVNHKTEEFET